MAGTVENEVSRLIGVWFKAELDRAWRQFRAGDDVREAVADVSDPVERAARQRYLQSEMADRRLDDLREAYQAGDYSRGTEAARDVVAELDVPIPEDDRRFALIAREVIKGRGHVADAETRWAEGAEDYTPEWEPDLPELLFPAPVPVELPVAAVVPETATTPEPPVPTGTEASGVTLSEAFQRYTTATPMKPATVADFAVAIRRFTELHGDMDLHHIQKRHIVALKDALLRVPRAAKRLTLPEMLAKAERDTAAGKIVPRLSPKTINEKSLAAIRATLSYAVSNDLVRENAAAGVAVKLPRNAPPPRTLYDPDDLRTIFALPIFTTGDRPAAGGGEAAVWLPILAIYTGARLEELATLRVGDVRQRDGVRFLFIRDGKTANARRKVPLHSEIVRLGFDGYLATRGSKPDTWLFPAFDNGRRQPVGFWSQWWGRYVRAAIPDRRKVFHSTRHTAKHALRNAGVDKTLRDAVMGHDSRDVAERYGLDDDGEGFALPTLAQAIERISYPGLVIELSGRRLVAEA